MLCGLKITGIFQSTLPARGATRGQQSAGLLVHYFNPRSPHGERRFSRFLPRFAVIISIHAPRTGSDHPALRRASESLPISIHAPRTGSDHPALRRASESLPISIHAPRTGSDDGSRRHFEKRGNFNPRSPHGERRIAWNSKTARSYFNPRSPHGERRWNCSKRRYTSHFNPRSPHGERPNYVLTLVEACAFQSTLPARGATALATRTMAQLLFQSTLPARGATAAGQASLRG